MGFNNRGRDTGCPCNGCADRHFIERDGKTMTCHAECEKYGDWKADVAMLNEKIHEANRRNDTMSDAKKRAVWRRMRYSRQGSLVRHKGD